MLLLHEGDAFGGDLHTQVPARHHQAIGDADDGFEVIEGLGFFDFGHQSRDLVRILTNMPIHWTIDVREQEVAECPGHRQPVGRRRGPR